MATTSVSPLQVPSLAPLRLQLSSSSQQHAHHPQHHNLLYGSKAAAKPPQDSQHHASQSNPRRPPPPLMPLSDATALLRRWARQPSARLLEEEEEEEQLWMRRQQQQQQQRQSSPLSCQPPVATAVPSSSSSIAAEDVSVPCFRLLFQQFTPQAGAAVHQMEGVSSNSLYSGDDHTHVEPSFFSAAAAEGPCDFFQPDRYADQLMKCTAAEAAMERLRLGTEEVALPSCDMCHSDSDGEADAERRAAYCTQRRHRATEDALVEGFSEALTDLLCGSPFAVLPQDEQLETLYLQFSSCTEEGRSRIERYTAKQRKQKSSGDEGFVAAPPQSTEAASPREHPGDRTRTTRAASHPPSRSGSSPREKRRPAAAATTVALPSQNSSRSPPPHTGRDSSPSAVVSRPPSRPASIHEETPAEAEAAIPVAVVSRPPSRSASAHTTAKSHGGGGITGPSPQPSRSASAFRTANVSSRAAATTVDTVDTAAPSSQAARQKRPANTSVSWQEERRELLLMHREALKQTKHELQAAQGRQLEQLLAQHQQDTMSRVENEMKVLKHSLLQPPPHVVAAATGRSRQGRGATDQGYLPAERKPPTEKQQHQVAKATHGKDDDESSTEIIRITSSPRRAVLPQTRQALTAYRFPLSSQGSPRHTRASSFATSPAGVSTGSAVELSLHDHRYPSPGIRASSRDAKQRKLLQGTSHQQQRGEGKAVKKRGVADSAAPSASLRRGRATFTVSAPQSPRRTTSTSAAQQQQPQRTARTQSSSVSFTAHIHQVEKAYRSPYGQHYTSSRSTPAAVGPAGSGFLYSQASPLTTTSDDETSCSALSSSGGNSNSCHRHKKSSSSKRGRRLSSSASSSPKVVRERTGTHAKHHRSSQHKDRHEHSHRRHPSHSISLLKGCAEAPVLILGPTAPPPPPHRAGDMVPLTLPIASGTSSSPHPSIVPSPAGLFSGVEGGTAYACQQQRVESLTEELLLSCRALREEAWQALHSSAVYHSSLSRENSSGHGSQGAGSNALSAGGTPVTTSAITAWLQAMLGTSHSTFDNSRRGPERRNCQLTDDGEVVTALSLPLLPDALLAWVPPGLADAVPAVWQAMKRVTRSKAKLQQMLQMMSGARSARGGASCLVEGESDDEGAQTAVLPATCSTSVSDGEAELRLALVVRALRQQVIDLIMSDGGGHDKEEEMGVAEAMLREAVRKVMQQHAMPTPAAPATTDVPTPAAPPNTDVPTPAAPPTTDVPTPAAPPTTDVPTPAAPATTDVPTPAAPPTTDVPTPAAPPTTDVPVLLSQEGAVRPSESDPRRTTPAPALQGEQVPPPSEMRLDVNGSPECGLESDGSPSTLLTVACGEGHSGDEPQPLSCVTEEVKVSVPFDAEEAALRHGEEAVTPLSPSPHSASSIIATTVPVTDEEKRSVTATLPLHYPSAPTTSQEPMVSSPAHASPTIHVVLDLAPSFAANLMAAAATAATAAVATMSASSSREVVRLPETQQHTAATRSARDDGVEHQRGAAESLQWSNVVRWEQHLVMKAEECTRTAIAEQEVSSREYVGLRHTLLLSAPLSLSARPSEQPGFTSVNTTATSVDPRSASSASSIHAERDAVVVRAIGSEGYPLEGEDTVMSIAANSPSPPPLPLPHVTATATISSPLHSTSSHTDPAVQFLLDWFAIFGHKDECPVSDEGSDAADRESMYDLRGHGDSSSSSAPPPALVMLRERSEGNRARRSPIYAPPAAASPPPHRPLVKGLESSTTETSSAASLASSRVNQHAATSHGLRYLPPSLPSATATTVTSTEFTEIPPSWHSHPSSTTTATTTTPSASSNPAAWNEPYGSYYYSHAGGRIAASGIPRSREEDEGYGGMLPPRAGFSSSHGSSTTRYTMHLSTPSIQTTRTTSRSASSGPHGAGGYYHPYQAFVLGAEEGRMSTTSTSRGEGGSSGYH